MTSLKVTFTLSESDVDHLRSVMRHARSNVLRRTEASVIGSALVMAREVRKFRPPDYVIARLERIESFVDMINDTEWALPGSVRRRILGALAYFTDPDDLIADPTPGLGFLDDAIMIELVTQDLRHELAGYQEFCSFRETAEQRPWTRVGRSALSKRLAGKRRQLRERIVRRRTQDSVRTGAAGPRRFRGLW